MVIEYKDGHAWSTRTNAEQAELLKKEIENLSPEEREVVEMMMTSIVHAGEEEPELIKTIGDLEWVRTPVDMETFCKDPYFLGNTCDCVYDVWLNDLVELFAGNYREAVFTGAIGTGKTFAASIGICRILYVLSCMRDPHRSFGIAPNSNISITCLSVSEMLAIKVAYENIATKIEASPYFQEHFPYEKTKKELRFPKHIWVAARASNDGSVLGLNVISGLLDETNFMPKASAKQDPRFNLQDRAEVLYNAMQRRMKSRFERKGQLPGILFVVSSKQTHDDFTARRINESIHDPTIFVRDYPLWGTKMDVYANSEWFHVIVGNEQAPSRIVSEDEDIEELKKTLPDDCVVVDVPEDFRIDFEKDIEGAIRDLAGVSTITISPYIQRRSKIVEAIRTDLKHPFSTLDYDPSLPGKFYWSKMVRQMGPEGGVRPIINPHAPRHIHIDPSLSGDATGFAMGHISSWVHVTRKDDEGGIYSERAPEIIMDVTMRVVPPAGGEIILGDVRRLVYELSKHGYIITCVSIDSWQSVDGVQKLTQKGFNAMQLSIDRYMGPYEMLKAALYENRLFYYEHPVLLRELRELQRDMVKRKIDHPLRGCFAGLTEVRLFDGSRVPLYALDGEEVVVTSLSPAGHVIPCRARGRLTKWVTSVAEVQFVGGGLEICTPEHLWLLTDGTYKEAQLLNPGTDALQAARSGYRHLPVEALRLLTLTDPIPVYDLEVDPLPNFALASGPVVHNSKDISDAVAGVVTTLTENSSRQPLGFITSTPVHEDVWMAEHEQHIAANRYRELAQNDPLIDPYSDLGMLPPFLIGSGEE